MKQETLTAINTQLPPKLTKQVDSCNNIKESIKENIKGSYIASTKVKSSVEQQWRIVYKN